MTAQVHKPQHLRVDGRVKQHLLRAQFQIALLVEMQAMPVMCTHQAAVANVDSSPLHLPAHPSPAGAITGCVAAHLKTPLTLQKPDLSANHPFKPGSKLYPCNPYQVTHVRLTMKAILSCSLLSRCTLLAAAAVSAGVMGATPA